MEQQKVGRQPRWDDVLIEAGDKGRADEHPFRRGGITDAPDP